MIVLKCLKGQRDSYANNHLWYRKSEIKFRNGNVSGGQVWEEEVGPFDLVIRVDLKVKCPPSGWPNRLKTSMWPNDYWIYLVYRATHLGDTSWPLSFPWVKMGDKVPTKVPNSEDDLEKKAKTHVK